jgi:lipoprotein-anchoring transpeptidase ErfK/SrfK
MLDRARFSPGVIDGFGGGNTARAVKAYQREKGMAPTGRVDAALLAALRGDGAEQVVKRHSLTETDLAGPFGDLPEGMEALSKVEATHYETAVEAIAEKFHMSQGLLRALNPDIDRAAPGDAIIVAATRAVPIEAKVARIEVDGPAAALRAYAADGRLLASYPATVGSSDFPSPSGKMEVRAIAPAPAYYFSPEGRDWGPDKRLTIAPGPNNPVGSTWIDLTKEGYGIHGSPDPRLIGKTASHGCVRLTNWDAQELAKAVEKGTTVEFL